MGQVGSRLVVLVDGAPLPEEAARELWVNFSRHMDDHEGDLAGFAAAQGFVRVSPEAREGKAVLVVWTREPTAAELASSRPPAAQRGAPSSGASSSGRRPKRRGGRRR